MSKSIFYWHLWKGMPSPHSEEGERENWCDDKRMRWGRTWCGLEEEKNIIKFSVIFLLFFGSLQDFFFFLFLLLLFHSQQLLFFQVERSLSRRCHKKMTSTRRRWGENFFLEENNKLSVLSCRALHSTSFFIFSQKYTRARLPPPAFFFCRIKVSHERVRLWERKVTLLTAEEKLVE